MGFGIISKGQIIESKSTLVHNAAGRGESLLTDIQGLIEESRMLDVMIRRRGMAPGMLRGITGGKRSHAVITNTNNPNLKAFKVYLSARNHGSSLLVTWYVALQPNLAERLMAFFLSIPLLGLLFLPFHFLGRLMCANRSGILDFDIYDDIDLVAFISTADNCLLDAVDRLMEELGQNLSVADSPQGFLGIPNRDR